MVSGHDRSVRGRRRPAARRARAQDGGELESGRVGGRAARGVSGAAPASARGHGRVVGFPGRPDRRPAVPVVRSPEKRPLHRDPTRAGSGVLAARGDGRPAARGWPRGDPRAPASALSRVHAGPGGGAPGGGAGLGPATPGGSRPGAALDGTQDRSRKPPQAGDRTGGTGHCPERGHLRVGHDDAEGVQRGRDYRPHASTPEGAHRCLRRPPRASSRPTSSESRRSGSSSTG